MTVALGVAVLLLAAGTLCKAQPQPPLVCPESTGVGLCAEFCSADTPCPDGQLCCSNGCGHSCMPGVPPAVNCSDPEQEGVQFNPTPCTFCTCEQGNKICAVVGCAYPDCDGGLKPVVFPGDCCPRCPQTTCPNTTGMLGTCVESCSDDSVCEDDRLCCSNGCGHVCTAPYVNCSGVPDGYTHQRTPCETCTCSGGERRCDLIICDWPVCPNGVSPVTAPGECCPGCPTSSCTEGGNSYASGTSWTCSDGCNTCRCDNGTVAMTKIACPPKPPLVCPEPTGVGLCAEFCSADTPCPDGQLCCSNGCGHSCMPGVPPAVNCSDPEQEGVQFNPTPCTFCTCEQGNKICAVVDCAYPDCDGGLKPVVFPGDCCPRCPQTTCPNTTGMLGTCVESCSDDSVCEDDRLCCSNGCGHVCTAPYVNCSGVPDGYTHQRTPCETCTCSGGERRCDLIICDWPVCPNGVSPVTAPGECCPGCPTSSCTEGGNSYASGTSWTCSDGCNTCRCDDGMVAMTEIGCPPTCTDTTGVHPSGDSWTCPDGCNTCTCHNGMVAKTDRACTPCTYGDNSYASGISWTCSDGCNTCSCRNGTVLSTLIACPPLRPCTDATGVHPSGDSWTCPDGCNTCTCFNGTVGSTRIACAPCTDGDTNAVHQSGESWRCRDGCPTCTCRHGSVVVNETGCPSNCTNGDGDIIPEGSYWQLNNDPCTTCFCMEGREACNAIACALPYCGPGVQPVSVTGQCCPVCPTPQRPPHIACPDLSNLTTTCDLGCVSDEACEGSQICCSGGCSSVCVEPVLLTCPDASGKVGTCVESCSNSSQCQIGQLCCSNGCGHGCVIADKLNCSLVECPAVRCSYGTPFTPEGECCPQCPVDCRAVFCAQPDCEDYEEEVIPKGGCCPVCRCKPSLCPVPLCLHGLPFTPEGECCQECPADCSAIRCAYPECESYEQAVVPEGQCCLKCQCNRTLCPVLRCEGTPSTPEGDCCPRCPRACTEGGNSYASGTSWTCSDGCNTCFCFDGDVASTDAACPPSCAAVTCPEVKCREGQGTVVAQGECCPACQDCSTVSCNVPECGNNEQRVHLNTQCCPQCQDCRSVDCAEVDCEYGRPFTPKGECCPVCPPEEKLCEEYEEELDVTDMDPCLECDCNAEFVYECRRVTSGDDCEAGESACAQCTFDSLLCHDTPTQHQVSCQLDDMLYRSGSVFTDGCSRCECTNGVVKCAEMGCSAVDGSGVRLEMGFAGNYDDYNDVTEQEELIKVLKKQLSSKFRHLSFMDSQVKDVKVHQGSVYLTFTIVAVEGGADPSTVAKTLETEHRTGTLVLVANNQTLVPLASTFSLTYVAAGSDMQDGSNVAAIVVPVVVGVVVIVAIVAAAIVILYAMKTARGQSAGGKANYHNGVCTIQNEYMMVDEKVKWDSSSIDSNKEVKV